MIDEQLELAITTTAAYLTYLIEHYGSMLEGEFSKHRQETYDTLAELARTIQGGDDQ